MSVETEQLHFLSAGEQLQTDEMTMQALGQVSVGEAAQVEPAVSSERYELSPAPVPRTEAASLSELACRQTLVLAERHGWKEL